MITLPLTNGLVALIDDEDVALSKWKWRPLKSKQRKTIYARRDDYSTGKRRTVYLHREVLKIKGIIDHKNGDGLDCRRNNLRPVTLSQNQHNSRVQINNKSGYRGVSWDRRDKRWRAYIRLRGILRRLGSFKTAEAAAHAHDAAASLLHGEFARLNFS